MDAARVYFTSIDDLILVADEDQNLKICNYNPTNHYVIFQEMHDFILFASKPPSFETQLQHCFSETVTPLILDQLSILNLRIIVECMGRSNLNLDPKNKEVLTSIIEEFNINKHESLKRLEKQLGEEDPIEWLHFFNSDKSEVKDEISLSFAQKVT